MSESKTDIFECPYCGNQNYAFADKCWVCFQPFATGTLAYPPSSGGPSALKIVGIVLATVIGVFGLAIVFVVAVLIALFYVCVSALHP